MVTTLMNLPTELLLEILSYLDYEDLKFSVPKTNTRLRDLTTTLRTSPLNEDLAERLFLDRPKRLNIHYCKHPYSETYYGNTDHPNAYLDIRPAIFKLHPCFTNLRLRIEGFQLPTDLPPSLDDIGFSCSSKNGGKFVKLTDTSTAHENATTPATSYATLNLTAPFSYDEFPLGYRDKFEGEEVDKEEEQQPQQLANKAISVLDFVNSIISRMTFFNMDLHGDDEDEPIGPPYRFREVEVLAHIEFLTLLEIVGPYKGSLFPHARVNFRTASALRLLDETA